MMSRLGFQKLYGTEVMDKFANTVFQKFLVLLCMLTLAYPACPESEGLVHPLKKERLVLMPMRLDEANSNLLTAMESSLVEGLQHKYVVYSGERVQKKVREVFNKESRRAKTECDETRCFQDIAITFQAELIAVANVTRLDDGYFLSFKVQNVFDDKVVYSKSLPCERCSAYVVVEKLKSLIGDGQREQLDAVSTPPSSNNNWSLPYVTQPRGEIEINTSRANPRPFNLEFGVTETATALSLLKNNGGVITHQGHAVNNESISNPAVEEYLLSDLNIQGVDTTKAVFLNGILIELEYTMVDSFNIALDKLTAKYGTPDHRLDGFGEEAKAEWNFKDVSLSLNQPHIGVMTMTYIHRKLVEQARASDEAAYALFVREKGRRQNGF